MASQRDLLQALLRTDLPSFIAKCFATLEPGGAYRENWHIHHIAHQLTRVSGGEVKRLIITIPPRHLKSICVTVAYTAWIMGHDPSLRILTISYGSDLAQELARQFRVIVESDWYRRTFPRFKVRSARKNQITTTLNGSRYATGVGGSALGRGADLIIADDPMKAEAASRDAERHRVNKFYDSTLSTRLNQKMEGAIIIIMQRLHEDDLVGHVLDKDEWEVSTIPAIETVARSYRTGPGPDDFYHRAEGEVIQATREDAHTLAKQRRLLGSMGFEAQYQQNPVPPAGNAIRRDWLREYDHLPAPDLTMVSWDTASTIGDASDFSVGTVWGLKGSDIYLVDVVRGQFEVPDLRRRIEQVHRQYDAHATLIEETELGRALVQDMRRQHGVRPILWHVRYDKLARLLAQAPKFEAGQVLLPRAAPWLGVYMQELLAFPTGKHDDQVDSTSQALDWLSRKIAVGVPRRRPNPRRQP
jgi:predicted phage terminase large subunit-like protein